MSEWFKVTTSKVVVGLKLHRGFKSHFLRVFESQKYKKIFNCAFLPHYYIIFCFTFVYGIYIYVYTGYALNVDIMSFRTYFGIL